MAAEKPAMPAPTMRILRGMGLREGIVEDLEDNTSEENELWGISWIAIRCSKHNTSKEKEQQLVAAISCPP